MSFSGPIGSFAANKSEGLVALKANKFPTSSRPNPNCFAKPIILLTVGSSVLASAVEGLRQINNTVGFDVSQTLSKEYRYN